MTLYRCDKCKEIFEIITPVSFYNAFRDDKGHYTSVLKLDLCSGCSIALSDLLKAFRK